LPNRIARALSLASLALAAELALAQGSATGGAEQVWIDLRAPVEGAVQTLPLAMVEVSGSSGAGRLHFHDVAIVIDLSASTRLRSGVDVNENGVVGKAAPEIREDYWGAASPEQLCDDPGDTIAAAEIVAVGRLLKLLDPERTRVALIAFGDRAEVMAGLDATRPQVLAALAELDKRHGWYGGTNYAAALDAARGALVDAKSDGIATRKRSILFLSDGYPTLPPPEPNPGRAAIASARAAGQKDVRIHSFALGPEAVRGRDVLDLVSRLSNGTLTEIERPGEVLFHLPAVELSDVAEVKLENQTAGQPGRAIRLLADGSFDGFVPLVAGRNLIRVTALGIGGGVQHVERTVLYQPAPGQQREVEIEVSRLRQLLRDRTVEVELAGEIRRAREQRRQREREIRIDVEKKAPLPEP